MSVVTFKKYSSYGDAVGDMDSAARAASEGDIDYLQKAFNSFDRDKSGFIDDKESAYRKTLERRRISG